MELSGQLGSPTSIVSNNTLQELHSPDLFYLQHAEPASKAQGDISGALRSFRDSLSFSFQTLNLTLSSMTQTLANIGTTISSAMIASSPNISLPGYNNQWIPQGQRGLYMGGVSTAYQQYSGANNLPGLLFATHQYNVSPYEFWSERNTDLASRASTTGAALAGAAAQEGVTLGAATAAGKALGSAFGLGGGMAGTLGRFALGLPFGLAAGAAAELLVDPMVNTVATHNMDVAAIKRMSPRFRSPFSTLEAQRAARGIENLAYTDILDTTRMDTRLNMSGFRDITMMGLQSNMFHGDSPEELVRQVSTASNVVKFLTGILGSKDVQETMQAVKQLKDMGLNSFQDFRAIQGIGNDAFSYGKALGMQASTLLNSAVGISSAAFGQYGNPAFVGIQPAIKNMAFTAELEKRGMLTAAEIAAGGGVQSISARMLSTQAGLLNNGAIGSSMLYAGWDSAKGFDLERYQNAVSKGGFWGSVGQAAANITGGGLGSIARSITEKNNLIASAAKNGDLDKVLEMQLQQALDIPLRMLPANASLEDKVAMSAVFLTQMSPNIDMSTAKAIAMKVLNPRVQANVDRQAKTEYYLGSMDFAQDNRGAGRFADSIKEWGQSLTAEVYHNAIERPARAVADAGVNVFDFSYRALGAADQIPLNSNNIEAYYTAQQQLKQKPFKPSRYEAYSNYDRVAAVKRMGDRGSLKDVWLSTMGSLSDSQKAILRATGISTDTTSDNLLTDATWVGTRDYMAPFFNKYIGNRRPTTIEGYSRIKEFSTDAFKEKDLQEIADKYSSNQDPMSPYLMLADWYNNWAGKEFKDNAEERVYRIANQLSDAELKELYGNELDINNTKNLTANDVMQVSVSSSIRDRAEKIAKRHGFTREQVMAGGATKLIGNGNVESLPAIMASENFEDLKISAGAFASKKLAQQLFGREDMPGMDLSAAQASARLRSVGLESSDVTRLSGELTSEAQFNAFWDAYEKALNGEDFTVDKDTFKNTAVMDILERTKQENKGFHLFKTKITDDIKSAGYKAIVDRTTQQFDDTLRDIGISGPGAEKMLTASNDEAKDLIKNHKLVGKTSLAKSLLHRVDELDKLSNEELAKKLNYQEGTITDANRYQVLSNSLLIASDRAGRTEQQKRQDAGQVVKTAVDTAIEQGKDGKNWLRVRVVSDTEIKDARESVEKNTDKPTKSENKGTLVDQQKPTSIQKFIKDIFHTN